MNDRTLKKFIIDAYRGGADTGNTSNNLVEKDFNLALSKYIYDRLITLGIPTTLTRDGDYDLDINSRINKIKSIYGTGNDIIVLSNALTKGGDGAEIIYAMQEKPASLFFDIFLPNIHYCTSQKENNVIYSPYVIPI